jgi:hypothetical protein
LIWWFVLFNDVSLGSCFSTSNIDTPLKRPFLIAAFQRRIAQSLVLGPCRGIVSPDEWFQVSLLDARCAMGSGFFGMVIAPA